MQYFPIYNSQQCVADERGDSKETGSMREQTRANYSQTSGPEVIKPFFILNSVEHEIFPANKY